MKYRFAFLLIFSVIAASADAFADSFSTDINGVGFGNAEAWCSPNSPPKKPTQSNNGFAGAALGPGIAGGCNPATFGRSTIAPLWTGTAEVLARGGDTVAGIGSAFLLSLLTPSAFTGKGSLSMAGKQINANAVIFTISFSLSNKGVGAEEIFFSLATKGMLGTDIQLGPQTGMLMVTITDPKGAKDIGALGLLAAKSLVTPEPASFSLLGAGLLGLIPAICRKITYLKVFAARG
jgi:hypothetical protein